MTRSKAFIKRYCGNLDFVVRCFLSEILRKHEKSVIIFHFLRLYMRLKITFLNISMKICMMVVSIIFRIDIFGIEFRSMTRVFDSITNLVSDDSSLIKCSIFNVCFSILIVIDFFFAEAVNFIFFRRCCFIFFFIVVFSAFLFSQNKFQSSTEFFFEKFELCVDFRFLIILLKASWWFKIENMLWKNECIWWNWIVWILLWRSWLFLLKQSLICFWKCCYFVDVFYFYHAELCH